MTDPAITEATARVLAVEDAKEITSPQEYFHRIARWHTRVEEAESILAAVTPLIEAAALEKAAKVVDEDEGRNYSPFLHSGEVDLLQQHNRQLAAAIRALIAKDSGGGDRYSLGADEEEEDVTDPAIIVRTVLEEASALIAKLELEWCVEHTLYDGRPVAAWCEQLQQALVALPMIEATALEKAAKVAEG